MLKVERVTSLLNEIQQENCQCIDGCFLFDFDGELLATTSTQQANTMVIKTAISSWFDFSDLGTVDEGAISNLNSMSFELEKTFLLVRNIGNSSFFLGFIIVDKKSETLGQGLRLIDNQSQKFYTQLSKLYTLDENNQGNNIMK